MKMMVLILLAALLSGCGARSPVFEPGAAPSADAAPSPSPSLVAPDAPASSSARLEAIQDRLTGQWELLKEKHALALQFVYSTDDGIVIEVRPYGNVEKSPSEEELEAFKASLFELAGETFPVQISVRDCCEVEPHVTGKITSVEDQRVLIVNESKKIGSSDMPEAYWVGLTADGQLLAADEQTVLEVDKSLVGREAKAWTTGLVNESYPAQTSAIRIIVE
ncbi:hypothetical protein [Cohnella hongkongensis]|uniref:DUF4362 domain-containing protein n=1 Tax=Cohnella hongkongensis TaxID=178337 RepID=A0ABV9FE36_9BACL